MRRVRVDYSDGCYTLIACGADWPDSFDIDGRLFDAYLAHLDQGRVFQDWIRLVESDQIARKDPRQ